MSQLNNLQNSFLNEIKLSKLRKNYYKIENLNSNNDKFLFEIPKSTSTISRHLKDSSILLTENILPNSSKTINPKKAKNNVKEFKLSLTPQQKTKNRSKNSNI
mmetsp:Transcript_9528/g.8388  ORF Transcript_9528/g.8388 Transcript_9528/m.8388 type:complete len:103 (-) Transcript_9528:184-492(-)